MKKRIIKLYSLALVLILLMSSLSMTFEINVFADDTTLPDAVDNSVSKFFPAIGNQGDQGACVCWAQVYYQFTYMMNRSMDVKTTLENTFSPTFNYNFANGGRGQGTWEVDVYRIMKEIGNVPLSTVPHNISEHNDWFATEEVWHEAMKYRIKDYTILKDIGVDDRQITSADDSDLNDIKRLLVQGEVLSVTTYIDAWDVERIKAHTSVPENDKYVDEYVVRLSDGTSQRHRLALVGYNDNIWTDVNENGKVDSGEMGALKIANSWGTDRHNEGFMWVAYDALNNKSCVSGCPTVSYRPAVFHDYTQIEVIPYDTDSTLYLRYTLNTADRSQGKIYATAAKDGKEYTFEVGPKRQHGMYASTFSYDGTLNANDGTMLCALSNIVPDINVENLHEYTWSVKFEDTTNDGKAFTVKNMEIVDASTGRISKPSGVYPFTLNGSSKTITFPKTEEYVPVTATVAPTTIMPTTEVLSTTQLAITEPTEATEETIVLTEPTETTEIPITTTVAPTETITDAFITTMPEVYDEYLIGDVNDDSNIKITDATAIQKYIAYLISADKLNLINSDCNKDNKVSVKDATCIQKYLAKLKGFGFVGEKYSVEVTDVTESTQTPLSTADTSITVTAAATELTTEPTEVITNAVATEPTEAINISTEVATISAEEFTTITVEATTESSAVTVTDMVTTINPTEEPTTTEFNTIIPVNIVTFTNSFGWQGTISCYYWSDSNQSMTAWPGIPMKNEGTNSFGESLFILEIPTEATHIIFTNGSVQTVDIPYSGGEQKFYPASLSSDGKYTVEKWQ